MEAKVFNKLIGTMIRSKTGIVWGLEILLFYFVIFSTLNYKSGVNDWRERIVSNQPLMFSDKVSQPAVQPQDLIRFHVIANSDSEEDQALKRAVRDAILKEVSPRLAGSRSLDESRQILVTLRPEMEKIAQNVVRNWGQSYSVQTDYGIFPFPTKSYGSLVLPAGNYEAVRVLIGQAAGSNWWCVLFPPLCFVDIEHATAVPVDGKPGIPIQKETKVVKFWFWEKLKGFLKP